MRSDTGTGLNVEPNVGDDVLVEVPDARPNGTTAKTVVKFRVAKAAKDGILGGKK
jgi:hypothetical protein